MVEASPLLFALVLAVGTTAAKPSIRSAVELASKWGIVTSTHRTAQHNRMVGGVPNSFHLSGRAVDISRRFGVSHGRLENEFRKAGYVLLESLDEGDHSHFAFDFAALAAAGTLASDIAGTDGGSRCPSSLQSLLDMKARRRPDHSEGCAHPPIPSPKYKPLASGERPLATLP